MRGGCDGNGWTPVRSHATLISQSASTVYLNMSGKFPFIDKIVSPVKCNEKPWDLWVSEIGHSSPRPDEDAAVFASPAEVDAKVGATARRGRDPYSYKATERSHRYRRAGLNRLKHDSMSFHGLFPQMDNLNAAVCHMCGVIVKCSAAYRHLLESHTGTEPILPPPPPAPTVKLKSGHSRSRHKKEVAPPPPSEMLPLKMETSPVHTATAPLSRIVLPQPELQYLDEASTSTAVAGEVQVCVGTGELPVVSIQDTEDLPLSENITDDIFAIMNSEGIQSADDITNVTDWKNIIRDIGNMQDINFTQPMDGVQQDMYMESQLPTYTLTESDLSNLQFAPNSSPMLSNVIDTNVINSQALKPAVAPPSTPSKSSARSKTSKTKFNLREYDPNKHCGVITADNPKPCTRSLTCKAHALSLRRMVEGRKKPFDTLLAEHRALREANAAANASASAAVTPTPIQTTAPTVPPNISPILVNTSLDLGTFNGLTAERQVNDIYASLLSVEDSNSVLPDTSSITSLLSQPLSTDQFLLPDDADIQTDVPILSIASPIDAPPPVRIEDKLEEGPPQLVPNEVYWYTSSPRPLSLCTFNASHAGGAITLGKKFATVRSNIKSSLSRSQCKTGATNNYYFNQTVSLSKTVHMNSSSKTNKPEVRKLIVTCGASSGSACSDVQQTFNDLFGADVRQTMNGHVGHSGLAVHTGHVDRKRALKHTKRPASAVLDLGFALDPLLADEKC